MKETKVYNTNKVRESVKERLFCNKHQILFCNKHLGDQRVAQHDYNE